MCEFKGAIKEERTEFELSGLNEDEMGFIIEAAGLNPDEYDF